MQTYNYLMAVCLFMASGSLWLVVTCIIMRRTITGLERRLSKAKGEEAMAQVMMCDALAKYEAEHIDNEIIAAHTTGELADLRETVERWRLVAVHAWFDHDDEKSYKRIDALTDALAEGDLDSAEELLGLKGVHS